MTLPRLTVVTASAESWGAERSLREMLESGLASRFRVTVVLSPGSPFAEELKSFGGVTVRFHRFAKHPALSRNGSLSNSTLVEKALEVPAIVGGALRLLRVLRGADLVLNFSLWQLPETMLATMLLRKPLAVDVHETFEGAGGARALSALLKRVSLVIAPSKYVLRRVGVAASEGAFVIPRPVKVNEFAPTDPEINAVPRLGIFGQIAPHKGVLEALEALEGCSADVLIVGGVSEERRSEYESEVRAAVAKRGTGSQVLDRVPDPLNEMSRCHYILNASRHEAFGRGVIEGALAGSVPVVLPDSGPSECVDLLGVGIVLAEIADLRTLVAEWDSADDMDWKSKRLSSPTIMSIFDPERIALEYGNALETALPTRTKR
jgi:glycosyltransferase involved in cell wall biosynthesis